MKLQTGFSTSHFLHIPRAVNRFSYIVLSLACFCSLFFFKALPVHAAAWQRVENFPITHIGALVSSADAVYAGTDQFILDRAGENGLYKIENNRIQRMLTNPNFRVNDLAVVENTLYGSFYYATDLGASGIYKSTNGGASWQPLQHFTTSPRAVAARGEVILAGTHDALWRSGDAGKTWEKKIQHESFNYFYDIAISETSAFASSNSGLYRSTDKGISWQAITTPLPVWYVAIQENTILASGLLGGLIRSTDNGATWRVIDWANTPEDHPFGPFVFYDSNTVFAGGYHKGANGATGTVFASRDGGVTWQKIDEGITHSLSSTQEVKALAIFQEKLYMALHQDGVFVRAINEPVVPIKIPVVLIPGIGGSEFEAKEAVDSDIHDCNNSRTVALKYDKGETVWVNEAKAAISRCDDYFDVLKLKDDGKTEKYAQISLKGTLYDRSYGKAVKFFQDNGYTVDKNLFIFPYDWRKDIRLTTPLLNTKVDEILTKTGSNKVNIVAHSMGGLVAREYIRDAARAAKVDTLVELGVPHLGSTDALASLIYGKCYGFKKAGFCLGVSNAEIKDTFQNLTGGYELINSKKYFNANLSPFRDDRDIDSNGVTGELSYSQLKDLFKNLGKNVVAHNLAEDFHDNLDDNFSQTNGVKVYLVAGSGIPTLGQIREYQKTKLGFIKVNKTDRISVNGDGTVPMSSAEVGQKEKTYYAKLEHGALIQSDTTLGMAIKLLDGQLNPVPGIQKTPFTLKGKVVSTHSPVELHVYDANGNHTGPTSNGEIEENIPESSYSTLGDARFITLPETGTYKIVTQATAADEFDLKVKEYKDNVLANETMYLDIPQTGKTKTELILDSKPNNLLIDEDGNGSIEKELAVTAVLAGNQTSDLDAPLTRADINGASGNSGWYRSDVTVKLSSTDNLDGSGVLKTEYSLDAWQTVHDYTSPITIGKEGITKIYFRSIDAAYNEESIKVVDIKIDKTPPELIVTFDIGKRQFIAIGEDQGSGVEKVHLTDTAYNVHDVAGNETELTVNPQNEPNEENDHGLRMHITGLSYNGITKEVPETNLRVRWQYVKGSIRILTQHYNINKQEKIIAVYNIEKEKGIVIRKRKGEKTIRTMTNDLVILQLKTDQGRFLVTF